MADRLLEFLFIQCLCWPLERTQDSDSRVIRVLGVLFFFLVWLVPIGILMILTVVWSIAAEVWSARQWHNDVN